MNITSNKYLYIRREINNNEKRVPIVPEDIKKLVQNGFTIYIESSYNRIFTDMDYIKVGAKITNLPWYDKKFKNYLIIGLKELENLDKLDSHTHMYFSHTYLSQSGSQEILSKFANSSSIIFDFDFEV